MVSLFDFAYLAGLSLFSPVWIWRLVRFPQKYREGWRAKLFGEVPVRPGHQPCIWFHAVSVGEVNLLRPLVQRVREQSPQIDILLSTTTRAGFQVARQKYLDIVSFYCPFDFSWAVRRAMVRMRPDVVALTELEIWPQLIKAAKSANARVIVVNARLSEKSFRGYRLLSPILRPTFQRLDAVAAQDEITAKRFVALGVPPERVVVTGSLKFDGAECHRNNPQTESLRLLAGLAPDETVFLAGSTQEGEEQAALEVFKRLAPSFSHLRLILVPRHPERFQEVAELLQSSGVPWIRRSSLGSAGTSATNEMARSRAASLETSFFPQTTHETRATSQMKGTKPVILVDTVGELSAWWGVAHIAFVGGSFGNRGGQNMLEPAGYGAAVSFGPNTWNFRDIVKSLLDADAAVVVRDARELENFVHRCLTDQHFAQQLGKRAQQVVLSHRGATKRTLDIINRCLFSDTSSGFRTFRKSA